MALGQFRKEFFIMKKNVMMRAASALLVAVLLTTSVISGTFAKYTTSTTGSDSARVAYWGFKQDATITIDLFDGEYNNSSNEKTVDAANDENVIAPGTSKEATFAFGSIYAQNTTKSITAPEVDYNFAITPSISGSYTNLDANPNFKWTLKAPGDDAAAEYDTVDALLAGIKGLVDATDGTIECKAGSLPDVFNNTSEAYTIGWNWDFETANSADQDKKDTEMGNATDLENVTLSITITATQVD